MKKILFAAAGLSALAAATPAAAQYYPAPQYGYQQPGYGQHGYGYGQPGYGWNDQNGLIRSYIVRADQLRQRVERYDSRDRISEREAARLRSAAIDLQNRTRAYARNGLDWRERQDLDMRIARLQQVIRYERNDGNDRRYRDRDRDGRWDARDGWVDRNRNGVDDRRERRSDWDRDGRWDGRDGWVDRNRNGIDDRYEQLRRDRDDDRDND